MIAQADVVPKAAPTGRRGLQPRTRGSGSLPPVGAVYNRAHGIREASYR